MDIKIVSEKISNAELLQMAKEGFGDMIKAVVDVERGIIAVGGELHADAEAVLLENGSKQENLWGINIYPGKSAEEQIEFTSLINIRPSVGNRAIEIQDENIKQIIKKIWTGLNYH
jgi:hypothetical protein